MKITVFGLTISSSWGNGHATPYRAIVKALFCAGHEIHFFEKDVPYYAKHRDLVSSPFCNLHLYPDWPSVRYAALACAAESDAVICASYCPEGARIIDEVLDLSRQLKVFYDLDTPVTIGTLERGQADYLRRDQIPEFDLYLSFSGGGTLDELMTRWGTRLALPLYGCVDPDVHFRTEVPPEYRSDFSYMGTFAADRQQKLEALFLEPARKMPSKSFVLAGSMYPWQWQWPQNVKRFEHVGPPDHPALYSSSRLTLNITRTEMARWGYCPSGRLFEAAACGTPIVTDWFEGLDHFFDCEHQLIAVSTAEQVMRAISLPDSELKEIAQSARQRTLDEHTGEARAKELISAMELASGRSRPQQARSEVA
ncbi:MAG TPA: glycosyltransferase [Terriglobales bacterium]|nr:glycosyltransferase [Terriglobales bacterium]